MVGGMVAGSQSCCCENPPPDVCTCPDWCAYGIEVVTPSAVAVSAGLSCSFTENVATSVPATIKPALDSLPGFFECDPGDERFCSDYGSARVVPNARPFEYAMRASAGSSVQKFTGTPKVTQNGEFASVTSQLRVRCVIVGNDARIFGDITTQIVLYSIVGNTQQDYYVRYKYKRVDLSGGCTANGQKVCFPVGNKFSRSLDGSEITASLSSTSLGAYDSDVVQADFGDSSAVLALVEAQGFDATFRITSRPSCRSVPADCNVPLEGNRIITFGAAADRSFVLGTQKSTTTGLLDGLTVNYEHYGTAAGTTADPWVFNAKTVREEDNRTIAEHNVELFCGLDDSVSPAVSRWYVREFTYCTPEFGQQTTGQWISVVGSYQANNECNGISIGDPVPIGSPDYEEVDGYPVVDFGDPCVPPAPIGLTITDLCP